MVVAGFGLLHKPFIKSLTVIADELFVLLLEVKRAVVQRSVEVFVGDFAPSLDKITTFFAELFLISIRSWSFF